VVICRCIDSDRDRWGRKPYATDCLLVLEIVSADSVTTDTQRSGLSTRQQASRTTGSCGPALTVERFLLTRDGNYISEELHVRRRDFHAVDTVNPFQAKITWDQLDEGL
jgi:hypothetical protein